MIGLGNWPSADHDPGTTNVG